MPRCSRSVSSLWRGRRRAVSKSSSRSLLMIRSSRRYLIEAESCAFTTSARREGGVEGRGLESGIVEPVYPSDAIQLNRHFHFLTAQVDFTGDSIFQMKRCARFTDYVAMCSGVANRPPPRDSPSSHHHPPCRHRHDHRHIYHTATRRRRTFAMLLRPTLISRRYPLTRWHIHATCSLFSALCP